MQKLLFFACIFLFLNHGNAQKPFSSVGAEWHYGISYDTYPPYIQGHYGLTCLRDTIIETDTFSNINNEFFLTSSDSFDYYFFRSGIPKKRLFKTNSQIGDTVTLDVYLKQPASTPDGYADTVLPLRIVINNIHLVSNNALNPNDSTKVFEFTLVDHDTIILPPPFYLYAIQGTYMSKVGQSGDFSNFLDLFSPSIIMTPVLALRCFSSLEYNYKPVGLTQPCDYANVGLFEPKPSIEVSIFPNPATNRVSVLYEKGFIRTITLFDLNGKRIAAFQTSGKTHQENIDVSTLKPGVYQCIVETDAGKTRVSLSVQ